MFDENVFYQLESDYGFMSCISAPDGLMRTIAMMDETAIQRRHNRELKPGLTQCFTHAICEKKLPRTKWTFILNPTKGQLLWQEYILVVLMVKWS